MKKSLCLALSFIMILSLLTGCSGQTPGTTTAPSVVEVTTTAQQAESTTETTVAPETTTETAAPATTTETAATQVPASEAETTTAASTEAPTEPTTEPTTEAPTEAPAEPTTEAPVVDEAALEKYREAVEKLPVDYRLSIQSELVRYMGKEVLVTKDNRQLLVRQAGSDAMQATESWNRSLEDNAFSGDYNYTCYYAKGTVILQQGEVIFSGKQTPEAFLQARVPLDMLHEDNYGLIEWQDDSRKVIHFAKANDTEWEWIGMDCSDITSVDGLVYLDEEGNISKTVYEAVFALEGIEFTYHITAELTESQEEVNLPAIKSDQMIPLGDVDAVPLMDLASCFYLTDGLTASLIAFIQSYATGAVILQQDWAGLDEDENGPLVYRQISRGTYGITNVFSGYEYRHFDGKTTYLEDDEETETDVSPEEMAEQILELMENYWLQPESLKKLTLSDEEDCWLIEFEVGESGQKQYFYNTDVLVEGEEGGDISGYKADICTGYLSIDKGSGLPIHMKVDLEGSQKSYGSSVPVYANYEMNFMGGDPDAPSTIRDEVVKGPAPENPATPLFYEITAPEGGKMWLIGTIHVGDSRTSHLPQEIYDALLASDALAVEIDVSNFEERLEEDEALMEAYQEATYYYDTSTAYEHLTEEQAEKLEKAIKKYGGDIMLSPLSYNVSSLTSYLEQAMLPLGRLHSYDRGVDNQLVDMAKENDIPVWDVEDFTEHITLLGSFSEKLQTLIMEETVDAGRYGSNLSTVELFNLWCRGDEAEIEESFAEEEEEDEDLTEEEKALLEEYNQGMMEKRNAEMVEKAKEYMASDQTVFMAVGLAHLMGEDGLLNCLRQAGYTVEQVQYGK